MQITCYKDFYEFMVLEVPRVTQPILEQRIKEAARIFAKESEQWKETLDSVHLRDGIVEYTLDWSWCARIVRIDQLRINTEAGVTEGDKGTVINPSLYEFTAPDIIELHDSLEPSADVDKGLEVDVTLVPEVGEWPWNDDDHSIEFINRWFDGIVAKAKADLLRMGGKRWTDRELAGVCQQEYLRDLNKAKGEVSRKYKNNSTIGA